MEKTTLGALFLFFIGVVVVLALFPSIADGVQTVSSKVARTNETFDLGVGGTAGGGGAGYINATYQHNLSHAPTGYRVNECPISGFTLASGNGSQVYTITTDYLVDLNRGNFTFVNSSNVYQLGAATNQTVANYTYCQEGYAPDGAARAMSKLILIFAAVALLGFSAYFIIKCLKDIS